MAKSATAVKAPSTVATSYADMQNARYSNHQSNLVDLVTRLNETINNLPHAAQRNWQSKLKTALAKFKKKYPNVKNFSDHQTFPLCQSLEGLLSDIYIDTTMQREPNLQWILSIIENFLAHMVQPIQVYQLNGHGLGAWDGQHTALALYLIATELGLDPAKVYIPITKYDINSRGQIRSNFIRLNTTTGKNAGKCALDIIDTFMQMIYGVAIDGVQDPEWVTAHAKWQHIANAGMFLTAKKFNNIDQVGAISRLNEIADDKTSVETVRRFAVYGKYVVEQQQRAIDTKEIPIIVEFLNLCEQQDIEYSDEEIEDLAQHCIDLFEANFDAGGSYWKQAHQAAMNAYNRVNKELPKHLWPEPPRNNKNTPQGLAFFWHQMKNTWAATKGKNFKFPKQPFSVYTPDPKDLF